MAEYIKEHDTFKRVVVNNKNQYLSQFPSKENLWQGDWTIDILQAIRMDRIHAQHTAESLYKAVSVPIVVETIVRIHEFRPKAA